MPRKKRTHTGLFEDSARFSGRERADEPPPGQDREFDAWFSAEVRKGIESGRREGYVPHEVVVAWIASLAAAKPLPRPKPRKRWRK